MKNLGAPFRRGMDNSQHVGLTITFVLGLITLIKTSVLNIDNYKDVYVCIYRDQ